MKQLFFLITIVLFSSNAFAQSAGTARLYGYKEPVTPGMNNTEIVEENGKESNKQEMKINFNYFIYLQTATKVYPSEMWIDGVPYSVTSESVKTTPVVRKNEMEPANPKTKILVPKTTQKLIMLYPAPAIKSKLTKKGKSLSAGNQLVVVYKQAGKFYYKSLKKFTVLDAAVMM